MIEGCFLCMPKSIFQRKEAPSEYSLLEWFEVFLALKPCYFAWV